MARSDRNNGNGNGDQTNDQTDTSATDTQEAARTNDAQSVEGAETATTQPQPGMPWSTRTDTHSPLPEGDTAHHNAGNASPAIGDQYPVRITTHMAPEGVMGQKPDRGPSPWPIAPRPSDPGLVSPAGHTMRPAHQEAAISHLTMRLGEMRNFLSGFGHDTLLADHPELHSLVAGLKHALGLPQTPEEVAAGRVGYEPLPSGPGTGGVARAGARFGNTEGVMHTPAGGYAQGSYGPAGVQENTN